MARLLSQVFRKDDYAVKYAVAPLLERHGPLADLAVQLKLLYGLGVLTRADYEDCGRLLALYNAAGAAIEPENPTRAGSLAQSDCQNPGHSFDDNAIAQSLAALHCATPLPALPPLSLPADPTLSALQKRRYQQIVRSDAVLSLSSLIARITLYGDQAAGKWQATRPPSPVIRPDSPKFAP